MAKEQEISHAQYYSLTKEGVFVGCARVLFHVPLTEVTEQLTVSLQGSL